jgi:hypothetical protein
MPNYNNLADAYCTGARSPLAPSQASLQPHPETTVSMPRRQAVDIFLQRSQRHEQSRPSLARMRLSQADSVLIAAPRGHAAS